jgi:hypothetical protein
MSDDELGTEHEEVVTSLLDLQRRLRGDEDATPEGASPLEDKGSDPLRPPPSSTIVVEEADLQILMTAGADDDRPIGTGAGIHDERWVVPPVTSFPIGSSAWADAEGGVVELQDRLERVEDDLSEVRGSVEGLKVDAETARAAEAAILDEVSAQREELRHAIDEGFRRLQETLVRLRAGSHDGTDGTD